VVIAALLIYAVLFILAALFWRWPLRRSIRHGEVKRPSVSIYGGLMRLQPGTKPVRVLLLLILLFAAAVAVVQWCCPWAAANIPILHEMSNYSPMTN
jgi:sortase A